MNPPFWLALSLMGVVLTVARAEEVNKELADAEKLLKEAGIRSDDASLIQYFRQRVPTASQLKELQTLVAQLGSDDFGKREEASKKLLAAGPVAQSFLKTGLDNPDPEIQRRCRELLRAIDEGNHERLACAAALLLGRCKEAETYSVLFAFLPMAHEESVHEAVLAAVAAASARQGMIDPVVVSHLDDKEPVCKIMAALLVGRNGSEAQRNRMRPMLSDANMEFRLAAARGLLAGRKKESIPVLIDLLKEAPEQVARQAEEALLRLADGSAPKIPWKDADKIACHKAWTEWWTKEKAKIDLAKLSEEIDFLNLDSAVRRAVTQFYEVILQGKDLPIEKLTDVPFDFFGRSVTTQSELQSLYANGTKIERYQMAIKRIYFLTAYAALPNANQKALNAVSPRSGRAVMIQLTGSANTKDIHDIVVFVRTGAGRPRVIGTRRVDEVSK